MSSRSPATPGPTHVQQRSDRFRLLDGLRFVAALAVLGFHLLARATDVWGPPVDQAFPTLSQYAAYGTLGVEFFFIISGFVILMTAWDRSLATYTASRIARLFPAYWAGVVLSGLLLVVLWPQGRPTDLGQVLVNLTMMQEGWGVHRLEGVYWTLWIELRFYVLMGVFMLIGLTRARIMAFCALWPLAAAVAATTDSPLLQTILMPTYAPLFAGGMMLYFIAREGHSLLAWLVVGANAVFAANAADHGAVGRIDKITAVEHSPVVVWAVVLGCFAVVALASLTRLRRVNWKWLTTLGALTYPLYLVHEFWGKYVIHLLTPRLSKHVVLLIAVAVALALAWTIHRAVERPFAGPLRRSVQKTLADVTRERPRHGSRPQVAVQAPATGRRGEQPVSPGPLERHDAGRPSDATARITPVQAPAPETDVRTGEPALTRS
jgi:peptidoglycan/LPS O-acetylase OafA/YrhL